MVKPQRAVWLLWLGCAGPADPTDTLSIAEEAAPAHGCAAPCDDGDACTVGDECTPSGCVGSPRVCDDDNPCTVDSCVVGDCVFQPTDGAPCVHECFAPAVCEGRRCGGVPVPCDDANPCTADVCVEGHGCTYTAVPAAGDDGLVCTHLDACSGGACAGVPAKDQEPCDDGQPCTADTRCVSGECAGGMPTVCPDTTCALGACDPAVGCVTQPTSDGAPCADPVIEGEATCREPPRCAAGACVTPAAPDGTSCGPGDACQPSPVCQGGACMPSQPVLAGTACPDASPCVTQSVCDGLGACEGEAVECDDGNPCTADGCDAAQGCKFLAIGEGAPCAGPCGETGSCVGGVCDAPDLCGDFGAPCELWTCAPGGGCVYAGLRPDGASCGSFCAPASCLQGACLPGAPPDCGVQCGLGVCDPLHGCVVVNPVNGYCNADGDPCTLLDRCAAGSCLAAAGCDDLVACTLDACVDGRCVHTWGCELGEAACANGLDDDADTAADCLELSCERSDPGCLAPFEAEIGPTHGLGLSGPASISGGFVVDGEALRFGPFEWLETGTARVSATLCCLDVPSEDLWLAVTEHVDGLPAYADGCPPPGDLEVRRTVSLELPFSTPSGLPLDTVFNLDLGDTPCGLEHERVIHVPASVLSGVSSARLRLRFMVSVFGGPLSGGTWRLSSLRVLEGPP